MARSTADTQGSTTSNYGAIDAGDSSTLHNGHVYNDNRTVHHQAQVEDDVAVMRAALFETDPEVDRQNLMHVKGNRVAGTCQWNLKNERYLAWMRGEFPVLTITGGPGKGKSMLADFVISELEKDATDKSALTYFFCLNDDVKRNNINSVLRGLLYHLIRTRPTLSRRLPTHFFYRERIRSAVTSPDSLWSALMSMTSGATAITCVLDGLDECSDDTYFFLSDKLKRSGIVGPRVVLFTRPIHVLRLLPEIQLDPENSIYTGREGVLFIEEKLAKLGSRICITDEFKSCLSETLARRARGTFLWIGFAVNEVLKQKSQTGGEICLSQLPAGLPAFYGRMLHQIRSEMESRCLCLLRWVAMALRPLSITEMAGVFFSDVRGPPSASQKSMIGDLVNECGSILMLKTRYSDDARYLYPGRLRYFDQHDTSIVLVHQSARDCLLRAEPDSEPGLEYWRLSAVKTNVQVLQACVACVERSVYREKMVEIPDLRNDEFQNSQSALLYYAADYIDMHAKLIPCTASAIFSKPFFSRPQYAARENWFAAIYRGKRQGWSDLFLLAAFARVVPWMHYLLSQKKQVLELRESVNTVGRSSKTLLMYATANGDVEMVRLLLEFGAGVNAKDQAGWRALHFASTTERREIMKILLSKQAEPTALTVDGKTALHIVVSHRGQSAGRLIAYLLEHGAPVDMADQAGMIPLIYAVRNNDFETAKCLLLAGSDTVNKGSPSESTVLHYAVSNALQYPQPERSSDMIKLLLHHGASVNALTIEDSRFPNQLIGDIQWHRLRALLEKSLVHVAQPVCTQICSRVIYGPRDAIYQILTAGDGDTRRWTSFTSMYAASKFRFLERLTGKYKY
ncbi:putative NACHT nucleoside triphosphatase, P-loop containing nucleoside triphosphate hydrolase [Septoria linicola]|nr:putative NACHT nucleoside triphosphatase, P-loop containing nucleoside triphosphate hydrolase [Septoria linicola]